MRAIINQKWLLTLFIYQQKTVFIALNKKSFNPLMPGGNRKVTRT